MLVGEATKRATEAAIAYEDAGEHELKGKTEPVHALAGAAGHGESRGGERARRSRAAVRRPRPRAAARQGALPRHRRRGQGPARLGRSAFAGIGKSRLAWEFEKYIDGLIDDIWWHRGRCLAYGEGVAYWALAEMVRMRAGILEDEPAESALGEAARDARGARRPTPTSAAGSSRASPTCSASPSATAPDQQDLFSAWRLFFERLAEQAPVVLVFEDLHWADAALLDFVEYLLEWSRNHPLFVLTLARPELLDRRPTWGAGRRNFHSLSLEPLPPTADGRAAARASCPACPRTLRARIRERAEGVPLYAVETVRMLLDRGLLEPAGDELPADRTGRRARRSGDAARADRRTPRRPRRRTSAACSQDASVLGKTFTSDGPGGALGLCRAGASSRSSPALVRKEILSVQADPRSPERGQYGFLQDLVQRVAYETLSRKERKARHLAAADYLERPGARRARRSPRWSPPTTSSVSRRPEAEDAAGIKSRAASA